jgi:hypothetical protein
MNAAVMTLAHYYARRDVKEIIRRNGGSVSLYPMSEISTLAKSWLADHGAPKIKSFLHGDWEDIFIDEGKAAGLNYEQSDRPRYRFNSEVRMPPVDYFIYKDGALT